MTRVRVGLAATAVGLGALGISACGSSSTTTGSSSTPATPTTAKSASLPGKGKPTFVMGDKNFPEEYVLGDLYQQALEAQGYTVKLKPNIGSTEVTFAALKSGQIQGYPEYDGTLLASVANDSTQYPNAPAAYHATVDWAGKHGYEFTNITPFTDSDAIATTAKYAKAHHLASIGDLKKLGRKVVLAGPPEFSTRTPDGLIGLHKYYGVYPSFQPSSIGSFYPLLDSGKADAAVVFTTDPQLKSGKYAVLQDTKAIFGWQNVGVVAKASAMAAEGPAFVTTINKVSALLTQNAIIQLNAAVELDKQNPATVAHAFLAANHLL
ncbi:MAG TPA: glycine betaine ABC transporter substrate-binding protein [Solirubrobacteraceae bacterium]|nr:glycine betaine ABC transporter substrate-binding protein [Solirubrobacteraceae bacterium]